ncbi:MULTISPECIES: OsmC family protein [unclassified Leucobacter]|uniref:OsmC family protein n=1 Tax=unclassified Leucobacter TaxID=2621730 RepID=UPI00165E2721|nr:MULTISPECIES: OsmC family protein [unclassified Leucobacter]MBC9935753.1 OsmC family protein [Leucobacter sp. cx-87]
MKDVHEYQVEVEWLGNRGTGTSGYRDYSREHALRAAGKAEIAGSADPTFRGDPERWNPEELLLGALAQCHMMSYLHMAVRAGIVVVAYTDRAEGTMRTRGLGGAFTEAVLRPVVTVAEASMVEAARFAHTEAREHCFIANSVNFPVRHEPEIRVAKPLA